MPMKKRKWYQKLGRRFHDWRLCHRLIFASRLKEELDAAYMMHFTKPVAKERDQNGNELYYRLGFIHGIEHVAKRMNIPLSNYFEGGPDK